MHEAFITVGDWSQDGHNEYTIYSVETTHTVEDLKRAYLTSCRKSGVRFHARHHDDPNAICTGFRENYITSYHLMMLHRAFRLDLSNIPEIVENFSLRGFALDQDEFVMLLLWFIGKSLKNFTYRNLKEVKKSQLEVDEIFTKKEIQVFNGWWDDVLNESLGYGLFCIDYVGFSRHIPGAPRGREINENELEPTKFIELGVRAHRCSRILGGLDWIDLDLNRLNLGDLNLSRLSFGDQKKAFKDWAEEYLKGRVYRVKEHFFYENNEDAVLLKMLTY